MVDTEQIHLINTYYRNGMITDGEYLERYNRITRSLHHPDQ